MKILPVLSVLSLCVVSLMYGELHSKVRQVGCILFYHLGSIVYIFVMGEI